MSELVVVAFKQDISRAAQVLGELRELDEPWTANIHGAIALYRTQDGKLTVDQSYESTKGGPAIGNTLIGSMVGLALVTLALPITAAIGGAVVLGSLAAGALGGAVIGAHRGIEEEAAWWKEEVELSEDFIATAKNTVHIGDSAIIFLLAAPDPTDFATQFQPYGGTTLRTTLTPEQTQKVRARIPRATQSETDQD